MVASELVQLVQPFAVPLESQELVRQVLDSVLPVLPELGSGLEPLSRRLD
jgi:hypothetical protein